VRLFPPLWKWFLHHCALVRVVSFFIFADQGTNVEQRYGDHVIYSCAFAYNGRDVVHVCGPDGKWVGDTPECKRSSFSFYSFLCWFYRYLLNGGMYALQYWMKLCHGNWQPHPKNFNFMWYRVNNLCISCPQRSGNTLAQGFPIRGACTPRGTFAYLKRYMVSNARLKYVYVQYIIYFQICVHISINNILKIITLSVLNI